MIWIEPVDTRRRLKSFIDFPHKLYRGDRNYVPELFIAQKDLLTPGKHPFHEHSAMKLFLVYKNNTLKGRIAAILNNNHNEFNGAADGFFGFFDCVDDVEIAKHLFTEAAKWLKEQGARTVIGPVNPSTNEPCGMLTDGFERPPVAMMVYNKAYYNRLVEECGFQKKVDLLAYDINIDTIDDRSVKLQESLLKRLEKKNITIRPINVKEFKKEVEKVREVYNAAWDHNLGFVPMTDKEFNYLAKDLKLVLDPKLCLVAEHNGRIIGFVLAIPDINQVLIKLKRGRLLPTGIFKLVMGLRKIDYVRVLALGVTKDYRKQGIEACFYASVITRGRQRKVKGAEASWILESNAMMNRGIESMNGKVYKKYRIYEKEL
jgi:GNAT superfamily N-acetyltransferase